MQRSGRLHPALEDIVERVWVLDRPERGSGPPTRVLPTGTVELLFVYGDPFEHVDRHGIRALPRSYVTGQRTKAVFARATGQVGAVIVSLVPWGLGAFVRVPVSELTDGFVDLERLWPGEVRPLEEALWRANSIGDRVRHVEEFLALRRGPRAADRLMRAASSRLAGRTSAVQVPEVARDLGVSERQFRRRFRDSVGVTPKLFDRIARFQRALRARRSGLSWAATAAECGFTDQAHLIHDVRGFADTSPAALDLRTQPELEYLNGRDQSRFYDTVYAPGPGTDDPGNTRAR